MIWVSTSIYIKLPFTTSFSNVTHHKSKVYMMCLPTTEVRYGTHRFRICECQQATRGSGGHRRRYGSTARFASIQVPEGFCRASNSLGIRKRGDRRLMSSFGHDATKPLSIAQEKETMRVANNLARIIAREVTQNRDPHAIRFLQEAMRA